MPQYATPPSGEELLDILVIIPPRLPLQYSTGIHGQMAGQPPMRERICAALHFPGQQPPTIIHAELLPTRMTLNYPILSTQAIQTPTTNIVAPIPMWAPAPSISINAVLMMREVVPPTQLAATTIHANFWCIYQMLLSPPTLTYPEELRLAEPTLLVETPTYNDRSPNFFNLRELII